MKDERGDLPEEISLFLNEYPGLRTAGVGDVFHNIEGHIGSSYMIVSMSRNRARLLDIGRGSEDEGGRVAAVPSLTGIPWDLVHEAARRRLSAPLRYEVIAIPRPDARPPLYFVGWMRCDKPLDGPWDPPRFDVSEVHFSYGVFAA